MPLHPLLHTPLEFNLAQHLEGYQENVGSWRGRKRQAKSVGSVGFSYGLDTFGKEKTITSICNRFILLWRATRGSNPGPLVPETNALSTELVALEGSDSI